MMKNKKFELFVSRFKVAMKALAVLLVLVIVVSIVNPFIGIGNIPGILSAAFQAVVELAVLAAISVYWPLLGRAFDWVEKKLDKLFGKVSSLWKRRKK